MWFYFAIASAILSGLAAVIEKKILFKARVIPFTLLLVLFVFLLSLVFLPGSQVFALTGTDIGVIAVKSVLGLISFILVMKGLKYSEISESLPLLVLTPGFVAISAFIVLGEALSLKESAGIFLLMMGSYILLLGNGKGFWDPWRAVYRKKGLFYISLAILLFTATSLLDRLILSHYRIQPEILLIFQNLFSFVMLLLFWAMIKKQKGWGFDFSAQIFILIAVLSVVTVLYRYFHFIAVKHVEVGLALSVKRTSVFFATIIGGQYFKEQQLLRRIVSVIIMLVGVFLVYESF